MFLLIFLTSDLNTWLLQQNPFLLVLDRRNSVRPLLMTSAPPLAGPPRIYSLHSSVPLQIVFERPVNWRQQWPFVGRFRSANSILDIVGCNASIPSSFAEISWTVHGEYRSWIVREIAIGQREKQIHELYNIILLFVFHRMRSSCY